MVYENREGKTLGNYFTFSLNVNRNKALFLQADDLVVVVRNHLLEALFVLAGERLKAQHRRHGIERFLAGRADNAPAIRPPVA